MSLDLLVGYAGLVSSGTPRSTARAYTLALVSPQYDGASLWTSLPLAVGAAHSSRSPSLARAAHSGVYLSW